MLAEESDPSECDSHTDQRFRRNRREVDQVSHEHRESGFGSAAEDDPGCDQCRGVEGEG